MSKVVKLAQPGYDVKTAGDENLIYSSEWPLLKIVNQGSFTTSDDATEHQIVVNHNLGYTPFFWFFTNNKATDWNDNAGTLADRAEFNGNTQAFVVATDKVLAYSHTPGFMNGTVRFYYYIFALDITKDYEAPIINVGGQSSGKAGEKVFKIAKPNKNISSSNLEDFVVHSRARSSLIHYVSNQPINNGETQLHYHNLGYRPLFFIYYNGELGGVTKLPNSYTLLFPDASNNIIVDENKISFGWDGGSTIEYSIVILKDPFDLNYAVNVSI